MDENAFAQASSLLQRMPVNRVAVFRALRLGDMLCAVPALRALRATLPHANITLVGLPWAADFARRFAHYVDDFIPFPGHPALPEQSFRTADVPAFQEALCNRRFELAIQMHGSGEVSNAIVASFQAQAVCGFSAVHGPRANSAQTFMAFPEHGPEIRRLLALMDFLGAKCRDQDLEFPITDPDLAELTDWPACASALEAGDYICIHPGASNISKCWPAERFAHVADALQREFALPVVLTGSAAERPLTQAVAEHMRSPAINAALPLSIGAMAALFSRARLLVCNDTGVSHIAAGLKLPSVVIFGQAEMERWAPPNAQLHRSIRDPEGKQAAEVLRQARSLLSLAEPATPSPWQALRAP